jgi:metallo-beta-lactamase class B
MLCRTVHALMVIAVLTAVPSAATAQTEEDRTQDRVAFPAHKILGNLYYVGTGTLNSYLITTPQGHILINTNFEETVPLMEQSLAKLGYKWSDVKVILGSHAHGDHMQANAAVKELTGGAQVMAMEQDVPQLKGMKIPSGKAAPIDRVLKDGETVTFGGASLKAYLTPGHTRGCTTWEFPVQDAGRTYNVVIACGGLQEDATLVGNKNYPEIADHFAQSIKKYKTLKPDIFLSAHSWMFDLAGKYKRLSAGASPNPYIDPAGFQAWVANMEKNWNSLIAEQKAATAK